MSKRNIVPVFVPHFGCPHDCVFCNQKKITNFSTNITPNDVDSIILEHLEYFREDSIIEVAFYGGSFTAIDIHTQSQLLEIPFKYKKSGIIDEIRLSTRPDAINVQILDNLNKYKVDTIELGVQSLCDDVLEASERGHSSQEVYDAVKLIKDNGFNLGLQMMIGLPNDTISKSLKTTLEFISLEPECVRIYPTLVIKDTLLEKQFYQGKYMPLSLDQAIEQTTILLMLFYTHNVNVIRVGLQPTDNIQLGKDVVAGPFHPAFRQLVESNIYKVLIDEYLKNNIINYSNEELIFEANKRVISSISGQKSMNINYWIKKYGFKKVRLYEKELDVNNINITIGNICDKIDMNLLMEKYISQIL